MAITNNVNKIKENQNVTSPAQTETAGSVGNGQNTTSQPTDLTSKPAEQTEKNNEVLQYLTSDEFKNLSEEEKLKVFKEKYCLGLSDEEAAKLYKTATKTAAEFAQHVSFETETSENTSSTGSKGAEAEIAAKKEIVNILKAEQGIENPTVADIHNYLKNLKQEELTPEQAKLLKTYNQLADAGFKDLQPAQSSTSAEVKKDDLIPIEQRLNLNFMKKSQKEKVEMVMDAFLTKNDPEYANLSAEEKAEKCAYEANKLAKKYGYDLNSTNIYTQKYTTEIISLLSDMHANGEKLSDLPTGKNALKEKANLAFNNTLKKNLNNILNSPQMENKTPTEQLVMIGDIILHDNKEYMSLSTKDKRDSILEILKDKGFPIITTGKSDEEIDNSIGTIKLIIQDFASIGKEVSFDSYMQRLHTPKRFYNILTQIERNHPEAKSNKEFQQRKEYTKALGEVDNEILKENPDKEITDRDRIEYLESKKNLSQEESWILNHLQNKERNLSKKFSDKDLIEKRINQHTLNIGRMGNDKNEINNYYTEEFERIKNISDKKESYSEFVALISSPDCPAEVIDKIIELAESKPYLKKEINRILSLRANEATLVYENGQAAGYALCKIDNSQYAQDETSRLAQQATSFVTADLTTWFNKYGKVDLVNACAVGIAGKNAEAAAETVKLISKSGEFTDKSLSDFTNEIIVNVNKNNPENLVDFANEFSNLNNAAVTTGLASAYNSVNDDYKSAYKSVVDNAVSSSNFTAEQKSQISTAYKTGKNPIPENNSSISNQAAARTTEQKTSQLTATVQSATVQNPITSHTVTADAKVSPTLDNAVTSAKTSATASTGKETEVSSARTTKQEALSNATSTKSAIDNSIKEWEAKNNTKLTPKALDSLKTAVSASVIEEISSGSQQDSEQIRKLVNNASSVNDLYSKLLDIYGVKIQDKFVELLASNGSSSQVSFFAKNNNGDVIKNLYLKCDKATLKTELLNMLPKSTIAEMFRAGQIEDLSVIDYKIIEEHMKSNLSSMSNAEFAKYLKFLPFDVRQELCRIRLNESPDFAKDNQNELVTDTISHMDTSKFYTRNLSSPREGDENSPFFYPKYSTAESKRVNTPEKGSDEWVENIRNLQSGIKVPPSSVHDTSLSLEDDFWEIGSSGSTKVPFRRNYNKYNHRGHTYLE